MKMLVSALAVLVCTTTASFAQSLPNYGPNAPPRGDSFGQPYSGAQPLRSGAHAYAYRRAHRNVHRHPRPPSE
jgi:hypothetical protein